MTRKHDDYFLDFRPRGWARLPDFLWNVAARVLGYMAVGLAIFLIARFLV